MRNRTGGGQRRGDPAQAIVTARFTSRFD